MRLIDADALIAYIKKRLRNEMVIAWLCRIIGEVPNIEAEPVRHGRWIWSAENGWTCSNCKFDCWYYSERFDPYAPLPDAEYCPKCGAKMDLPN